MTIKLLLPISAMLCFPFNSFSQNDFEFQAGYGMYSLETMFYQPHKHYDWALPDMTIVGSYFATCRYRLTDRFSCGFTMNYFQSTLTYLEPMTRSIGLSPDICISYNKPGLVHLYMSVAGGLSYAKTGSYRGQFAPFMHYSPLGIEVGRVLGGFAEIGIGSKGVFNLGISYRPGNKGPGNFW